MGILKKDFCLIEMSGAQNSSAAQKPRRAASKAGTVEQRKKQEESTIKWKDEMVAQWKADAFTRYDSKEHFLKLLVTPASKKYL